MVDDTSCHTPLSLCFPIVCCLFFHSFFSVSLSLSLSLSPSCSLNHPLIHLCPLRDESLSAQRCRQHLVCVVSTALSVWWFNGAWRAEVLLLIEMELTVFGFEGFAQTDRQTDWVSGYQSRHAVIDFNYDLPRVCSYMFSCHENSLRCWHGIK